MASQVQDFRYNKRGCIKVPQGSRRNQRDAALIRLVDRQSGGRERTSVNHHRVRDDC
jgi:hypothetical protein